LVRSFARRLLDAVARRVASGAATSQLRFAIGSLAARQVRALPAGVPLVDAEFQAYSQWGDDGIIQYLVARIRPQQRTFVEFGVEDYSEANTRFLLMHDNWSGLVIDSSPQFVDAIRRDTISWRHDLTATCALITRENIDALIAARFPGPALGLLSIDIDGNDYWVWQAIRGVQPEIVVCEYNAVFGPRLAVSVPYRPDFARTQAHFSNLYFGASLPALCALGTEKGYAFVGCNSAGNNAFFVRRDRLSGLREVAPEEGYVDSRFRESRGPGGQLTHLGGLDRLRAIDALPLVEVRSGRAQTIRDLYADMLDGHRAR
jgi:hypothetical protein